MLIIRETVKRTFICQNCHYGAVIIEEANEATGTDAVTDTCTECNGKVEYERKFNIDLHVDVAGWNHLAPDTLFVMARDSNIVRDIAPKSVLLDRALDAYLKGPEHELLGATITEVEQCKDTS